jgi:hypothetical protein
MGLSDNAELLPLVRGGLVPINPLSSTAPQSSPCPNSQIRVQYQQQSTREHLIGVSYDMNANAFRHFYEYHFAENRKIWDSYVTQLSHEQFTEDVDYSLGSVRDQILHLISVDDTWFSDLRGVALPEPLNPADLTDLESIRAHWDNVEQSMRDYLGTLRDDMLSTKPLGGKEEST